MKIVALLTTVVPYHHARWQAFAAASGHAVHLVEIAGRDEFGVLEYATAASASYQRTVLFKDRTFASLAKKTVKAAITRCLDDFQPDVLCVNGYWPEDRWVALDWARRQRCPVVLFSESNSFDQIRKPWKEWIKKALVAHAAAGLAGGTPQKEYLIELGLEPERVFTGYDIVDNAHFSRSDFSRPPGQARHFLACARFTDKKNHLRLIEAYHLYRQQAVNDRSQWHLVIVGDGPLRGEMESRLRQLDLESFVQMPGASAYAELPDVYAAAGALIHPSTVEQWGLVVNEAMAAGLPVLVSERCGCARDLVVEGRNGFYFNPENVESIAGALKKMSALTDEEHAALGVASREIVANWGPECFARGLSGAVEAACAKPGAPTFLQTAVLKTLLAVSRS